MKREIVALALGCVISTGSADAAREGYVITIQNVELKKAAGEWVSVIRPDKQVDVLSTEATVSFFNNQGRVPFGPYTDFRVEFLKPNGQKVSLGAIKPLDRPLEVRKGSFIRVSFDLEVTGDEPSVRATTATVAVDERNEIVKELTWS